MTLSVVIDCRVVLASHHVSETGNVCYSQVIRLSLEVRPPTRDWPYVVRLSLQVSTRIAWQAAKVKCVSKSEFIIICPPRGAGSNAIPIVIVC